MSIRQRRPYYVPRTADELREGLRRMGVERVNGKPLSRIHKRQLTAVYLSLRDKTWDGPLGWGQ